jgi:hypothetical protein
MIEDEQAQRGRDKAQALALKAQAREGGSRFEAYRDRSICDESPASGKRPPAASDKGGEQPIDAADFDSVRDGSAVLKGPELQPFHFTDFPGEMPHVAVMGGVELTLDQYIFVVDRLGLRRRCPSRQI